jgi:aspartokinase/homoserine dehydrogenase 1
MAAAWVVHKFGGTSVANAERYRGVAKIVRAGGQARPATVVSAMSGVTDALIDCVERARARDDSYLKKLTALKIQHLTAVAQLLPDAASADGAQAALAGVLESDFRDLEEVLRGVWLVRSAPERTVELVSGYGEVWSAQFLDAFLRAEGMRSRWLDARQVLVVDPSTNPVSVDWAASEAKVRDWQANAGDLEGVVITGFVATTSDGVPTTLKRNGSDFSASIFARLLGASSVTIWKEVDGVMSADPRHVPEAVVLDELSYDEAAELAYFGAKVVHPATMSPAIQAQIPIYIRNSFDASLPGTKIHGASRRTAPVKGFATVDGMALVNVEGTGMIGVPGVAQRLFGSLREVGVSVVMISQASSEHSICFAVPQSQAALAKTTVEKAFFAEIHHGQIEKVDVTADCSILAAVGDGMVERAGVAGNFFGALGRAGVSVRAIAQGSSERNISAVVSRADARRGLRAVHSAFYLSNQTLSIGLLGCGLIGGTLLDQLRDNAQRLKREFRIDLRVRGIMNRGKMLLDEKGLELAGWRERLASAGQPADLAAFARHVHAEHLPHAVLVDATASAELPAHYVEWLKSGIHIVTPNKKGNTGTYESYRRIRDTARATIRHYLYETTVGAGLPVINTLRDLVQTGDQVTRIEGILSGTLSYLFSAYDGSAPFSEIVREAKRRGYTEPDPRDDLSGMDVARKLAILAREMGQEVELSSIYVQNLVPEALRDGTAESFLQRLPELDPVMGELLSRARSRGEVLRYVGSIEPGGRVGVELRACPATHPFARIGGGDNVVAFHTKRYSGQPLIVQGPGAGPEVTAGGVFADLLRLASYLGAPL